MSYISDNLIPNEQVLYRTRLHWKIFVPTVLLLLLNDTVTRLTEYYGIVLGIVILFFAIGLRKGLMDFAVEWYEQRRDSGRERAR